LPIWKAQIAHIYLDPSGEISLYPQVGQQIIDFGTPTDIQQKFDKLFAFYNRIVPVKGWSAFSFQSHPDRTC
jgi:cell division protein FtsQ